MVATKSLLHAFRNPKRTIRSVVLLFTFCLFFVLVYFASTLSAYGPSVLRWSKPLDPGAETITVWVIF